MKKVIAFLILFTILILLGLWSPWLNWNFNISNLFGVNKEDTKSGLQVFTENGDIEIFIEGESVGVATEENSVFLVDNVEPGSKLVTLRKVSDIPGSFWSYGNVINFIPGINVVMSFDLATSEEFSQGHIIYVKEKSDINTKSNIILEVNEADAEVLVDDISAVKITNNKLVQPIDLNRQHNIVITKAGFENIDFTILPESQEDRDKLKDYDIYIEVKLAASPLKVE